MVGEDDTTVGIVVEVQIMLERAAIEDVVTQNQGGLVISDEVGTEDKRLRQPVRHVLDHILEMAPDATAVTEKPFEMGKVGGGGDDENVADSRRKQRGKRIINHRFVVNRHQLLAHSQS